MCQVVQGWSSLKVVICTHPHTHTPDRLLYLNHRSGLRGQ